MRKLHYQVLGPESSAQMGFVTWSGGWLTFGEEAGKADDEEKRPGSPHLLKML